MTNENTKIYHGYKLFRKRKDGSIGSLFINRKQRIPFETWLLAESHRTKGYAFRPGWHVCRYPNAPHLHMIDREWKRVEVAHVDKIPRPKSQGGEWWIAGLMKVHELADNEKEWIRIVTKE